MLGTVRRAEFVKVTRLAFGMLLLVLIASSARADIITQIGGTTGNYILLFEGGNSAQLHTAAATIHGNVGIGGTGQFAANGGGSFGNIDFAAANTGQFTTSGSPTYTSLNYGVTSVTTDLNDINNFSAAVATESGSAVMINLTGTTGHTSQVIKTSQGTPDGKGNYVFTVSSAFTFAIGTTLTVVGDIPGNVIFNFINFGPHIEGNIVLQGITSDQVLFNVTGGELKIDHDTVSGTFADPTGKVFVSATTLYGRVFGGDSTTMQIVSADKFTTPTPEPAAVVLFHADTPVLSRHRQGVRTQ
jgi:hypothetical protein